MKNSTSLKWLSQKTKGQRKNMAFLIFANVFFSILTIAFAVAIKYLVKSATKPDEFGGKSGIIIFSVVLIAIVLLQFVFRIITNSLSEHIRGKMEMSFRSYIFDKILNKKYDKITAYHSGELMNRLTNDVSIICDGYVSIIPTFVSSAVRLLLAFAVLCWMDWVFAIAFTVAGLSVFLVLALIRGKLKGLHKKTQETYGKSRSFMQESIENLLAIKVFSVDKKIEKHSDDLQLDNFKVKMTRKNYAVFGNATYNMIFSAGYLFALIYGCIMIFTGSGTFFDYGDLAAILQLVNSVQVPFASFSTMIPKYYEMVASTERLIELENIQDEPQLTSFDRDFVYNNLEKIEVRNLSFGYNREIVLEDTSVTINKGDFVVITGISGIGKSTLLKLLLGVYSTNSGGISLVCKNEEIPISNNTRRLFNYVPQGNMLFSGTLLENVTFINSSATEEEVNRVLELSCAIDFIKELPDGLNTVVGEKGIGLSEGQIQRIAIARALLSGAPVFLLDEATSALDEDTEIRLLNNLKTIPDVTLITVSHKKAAISICNRVFEIVDKKLIETEKK